MEGSCVYRNIFLVVIKIKTRGENAMNGSKLLLFLSAFIFLIDQTTHLTVLLLVLF